MLPFIFYKQLAPFYCAFLLCVSFCLQQLKAEDIIYMKDGDSLQGQVINILPNNTVQLQHHASEELLEIDTQYIKQLIINQKPPQDSPENNTILHFINGDKISGKLLEIDATLITLKHPVSGLHQIERKWVHRLDHSQHKQGSIFDFEKSRKLFSTNKNWFINHDKISSQQAAIMWQKFNLPSDFAVSFKIHFKDIPNIILYLAAKKNDLKEKNNNRYELYYNGQGLRIDSFQNNQRKTIAKEISLSPDGGEQENIAVKLYFSREHRTITLWINGIKYKTFRDLSISSPKGSYIGLQNVSTSDNLLSFSEFKIHSWSKIRDEVSQKKQSKQDILIIKDTNVHSGSLKRVFKIKGQGDKLKCHFTHESAIGGRMQIPFDLVSSVHFANTEPSNSKSERSRFHEGTELTLTEIHLTGDKLQAKHPYLGSILTKKQQIISLNLNKQPKP